MLVLSFINSYISCMRVIHIYMAFGDNTRTNIGSRYYIVSWSPVGGCGPFVITFCSCSFICCRVEISIPCTIIKYQRAVCHLGFIGHQQIVNHLSHNDFARIGQVAHLIEVDTINKETRREYHLPLATDNQISVVRFILDGCQEDKIRSFIDGEALQSFRILFRTQCIQYLHSCICTNHLRLCYVTWVILGIFEDCMTGTEYFHILHLRTRVSRI